MLLEYEFKVYIKIPQVLRTYKPPDVYLYCIVLQIQFEEALNRLSVLDRMCSSARF